MKKKKKRGRPSKKVLAAYKARKKLETKRRREIRDWDRKLLKIQAPAFTPNWKRLFQLARLVKS